MAAYLREAGFTIDRLRRNVVTRYDTNVTRKRNLRVVMNLELMKILMTSRIFPDSMSGGICQH
jgi:hypothetical protein